MKKKIDYSKPKPVIPAFNGPAHYARLAAMQAPATEQGLVVAIGEKKYELKLPLPLMLTEISGVVVPPEPVEPGKGDGIGTNTFPWVPLEKLTMFSTLRCYIAAGWIWRPGGLFVQPMFQAETEVAHGLDEYFGRARDAGIDILPCINQTPDWYAGTPNGFGSNDHPPIKPGKDRNDPASWADYAEFWFQFVARYGSVKHPDSVLQVDTNPRWNGDIVNVKKSGLGMIKCVEIGNELDIWWAKGTDRYLKPSEHAAMLTAVISAIKRADPAMVVVMAGLTGFDLPYLKELVYSIYNLGGELPDVLNVHHYSSIGNERGKWPPTWPNSGACYPEEDKDFVTVSELVAYAKALNRPLWVTEFGCDSRAESWMHIKGAKYGITDEQAQANLIEKTFRAYKKYGVERAYVFTAVDEPGSANGGLWQNCGLMTNQQTGFQDKPAKAAVKKLISESSNV
jgi:hypothetical protein